MYSLIHVKMPSLNTSNQSTDQSVSEPSGATEFINISSESECEEEVHSPCKPKEKLKIPNILKKPVLPRKSLVIKPLTDKNVLEKIRSGKLSVRNIVLKNSEDLNNVNNLQLLASVFQDPQNAEYGIINLDHEELVETTNSPVIHFNRFPTDIPALVPIQKKPKVSLPPPLIRKKIPVPIPPIKPILSKPVINKPLYTSTPIKVNTSLPGKSLNSPDCISANRIDPEIVIIDDDNEETVEEPNTTTHNTSNVIKKKPFVIGYKCTTNVPHRDINNKSSIQISRPKKYSVVSIKEKVLSNVIQTKKSEKPNEGLENNSVLKRGRKRKAVSTYKEDYFDKPSTNEALFFKKVDSKSSFLEKNNIEVVRESQPSKRSLSSHKITIQPMECVFISTTDTEQFIPETEQPSPKKSKHTQNASVEHNLILANVNTSPMRKDKVVPVFINSLYMEQNRRISCCSQQLDMELFTDRSFKGFQKSEVITTKQCQKLLQVYIKDLEKYISKITPAKRRVTRRRILHNEDNDLYYTRKVVVLNDNQKQPRTKKSQKGKNVQKHGHTMTDGKKGRYKKFLHNLETMRRKRHAKQLFQEYNVKQCKVNLRKQPDVEKKVKEMSNDTRIGRTKNLTQSDYSLYLISDIQNLKIDPNKPLIILNRHNMKNVLKNLDNEFEKYNVVFNVNTPHNIKVNDHRLFSQAVRNKKITLVSSRVLYRYLLKVN